MGSVRGVTDASGALVGSADYDVFGAVRNQTGASTAFGFTGEQFDAETGFTYLRARSLNPSTGRFLSRDTIQPNAPGTQGYNLYAYVANNPTTWTDPSGHQAQALDMTWRLFPVWWPIAIEFATWLVTLSCGLTPCSVLAVFVIAVIAILVCVLMGPCGGMVHAALQVGERVIDRVADELEDAARGRSGPTEEPKKPEVAWPAGDQTKQEDDQDDPDPCRIAAANVHINPDRRQHIETDHGPKSTKLKSKFLFEWDGIEALIRLAVASPNAHVKQEGTSCVFEYDAGVSIGVSRNQDPESMVRVVLAATQLGIQAPGSVLTAYPISNYEAPRTS